MWDGYKGYSLYLDTNIIIYAIEQGNRWTETLRQLFATIDGGEIRATTSELTIAEVLPRPYAVGADDVVEKYQTLLSGDGALKVVPIDRDILDLAAQIRASHRVKLMDAIHIATAADQFCDIFLSNDAGLNSAMPNGLKWLSLPTAPE